MPSAYFEFLRTRLNQPLVDGYDAYSRLFTIHFRDRAEFWVLEVRQGRLVGLAREAAPRGDVCFDVDAAVFWEIVTGRLSAQAAFFQRRTHIRGNLFEGLKLARILGLFFARHPYPGLAPGAATGTVPGAEPS